MKKVKIVRKTTDYSRIINKKQRVVSDLFSIFREPNNLSYNRYGVTVPTKLINAVGRNKIKRQIKSIIDNNEKEFKLAYDYVIIIRKGILNSSYKEMEEDLIKTFKKVKGD